MWSNPFKHIRRKRNSKACVPPPEAILVTESSLISRSAIHAFPSTASPYSVYTSYTTSSSRTSPPSMPTSSATSSPAYPVSSHQTSPYYPANSLHPSPRLYHYPPPQVNGITRRYSQGDTLPAVPPSNDFDMAISREDQMRMLRQYDTATLQYGPSQLHFARAIPPGLVQAVKKRGQEEEVGATTYVVAEEHLSNMRQALSGATGPVAVIPTVVVMPAGVPPPQARKDSMLAKIEEAREPEEEGRAITTGDSGEATPELSMSSGSPASRDTFPSPLWVTGSTFEIFSGRADGGHEDELDDAKRWEEETVYLLTRIGKDE